MQSGRTNFVNRLVSLDLYGKPVQLTFLGKAKYKTIIGAVFSISVVIVLFLFTIFNAAKLNQLAQPIWSEMHEESFYKVNDQELELSEILQPSKIFAMSLGNTLVDESIGRFVVTQRFTDSSVATLNTEEVIPLVPCSQTQYASLFTHLKGYEALYCLKQYDAYQVKGNV